MSKYGFYFANQKDNHLFVCCPHCKSHSTFNPNSHEELLMLFKLSNDAFKANHRNPDLSPSPYDLGRLDRDRMDLNSIINSSNIVGNPVHNNPVQLVFPAEKLTEMQCLKCNESAMYCHHYPDSFNPCPFYVGTTVTEDYKRIQMNVKGYFVTFFHEKVQAHYYMTRIVFNKRTGRTTVLQPLGSNNKPLPFLPEYTRMWNITYGQLVNRRDLSFLNGGTFIIDDFKEQVVPRLIKGLKERFSYIKDNHFDECFQRMVRPARAQKEKGRRIPSPVITDWESKPIFDFCTALKRTVRKFRFHDLPMEFLDSFDNSSYSSQKVLKLMPRVGFTSKQQQSDLMKLAGRKLPKSIRKEALKSISNISLLRNVRFIKSPLNMLKLMQCLKHNNTHSTKGLERFFTLYMDVLMKKNEHNFKDTMQDKLYDFCETIAVNRLSDCPSYVLHDTYDQLSQIYEQGETYEINTSLSIRQLHDDVSSALRKIKTKNQELSYTEEEQQVEWQYSNLTFRLAPDTHYLIEVGAKMNICVGGYGNRAQSKHLHIVTVSSPDNPHECCIELTADMKTVRQAKTKHNNKPQGELQEAVLAWVKEKNLLIGTHDLPRENSLEGESFFDGRNPIQRQQPIQRNQLVARPADDGFELIAAGE